MGGGMSGLFPSTKGAEPQQMTLFPSPIPMRRCSTTHAIEEVESLSLHVSGAGINRGAHGKKDFLLTPYEVLRKCLHWRIGAITSKDLVRWIQRRLDDNRYNMIPNQLRNILEDYLLKLKSAEMAEKNFNKDEFLICIEHLEEELESIS